MPTNQLLLSIDVDGLSAGLRGTLNVDGFSGHGEGWFNLSEIEEFVGELRGLALELNGKVELVGGHWETENSEFFERFGLRFYPVSKTGNIGVHITLAEYPYTDCRKEEVLRVTGELNTEVQLILNFIEELSGLISGNRDVAVLEGI